MLKARRDQPVEGAVQRRIWHLADMFSDNVRDIMEWLELLLALVESSCPAAHQCHVRNAVPLFRNKRQRGRDLPGGKYAHLFGSVLDVIAIELENSLGVLHVEKHRSAVDVLDRTQLELERGQDTKVAASATNGPKQVFVLVLIRDNEFSVRGDHICGDQVVQR